MSEQHAPHPESRRRAQRRRLVGLMSAVVPGTLAAVALAPRAAGAATVPTSPSVEPGAHALHETAATAGFAAYALMVGTVAWGLLITTGLARRGVRRQTLYGGHMTMAVMTVSFTAIHALGNVLNPSARLSAFDAVLPVAGGRPFGVAAGVVGAELLVAVAVSVWFQRRLSYRVWHAVHWLAYPAYGLALAHTFISGSDVRAPLVVMALSASLVAVLALFVLRALPSTSLVRTRLAPVES